jgi:phage recombination protein Bet
MSDALVVTNEQVALVKKTIAQDATDEELKLFLFDCQRQGVHPLDRLLHFTKRSGKYTPITSIDLMRTRAAETGEMAGSDDAVFSLDGDERLATVTVYRLTQATRYAYTATARWSEYYPGDGNVGVMWRKMPHTMLSKCAEALALRKAFPKQLAGLYAREELDQADIPVGEPMRPARWSTTETPDRPRAEEPKPPAIQQGPITKENREARERLLARADSLAATLDYTEQDVRLLWQNYCGAASRKNVDVGTLGELVEFLEHTLEEKGAT